MRLKRKEPEKLFQESLVQALSLEGRVAFIHPYYPRSLLEAQRAKKMGLQAGWPDLIFPAPGSLGLELKAPGGRQSLVQQNIQAMLTSHGIIYEVVNNFDAALETIQQTCKWGYE